VPVAAIPAAGLLAGSAGGLLFPDSSHAAALAIILGAFAGVWALRSNRPALLAGVVALAFGGGGALLSADAWRDAWRPPLRIAFEEMGGDDGTAFAVVTGVLRADAVQRESGVSLSLDVVSIGGPERPIGSIGGPKRPALRDAPLPTRRADLSGPPNSSERPPKPIGGLLLTVAGELARGRIDEWRAGRTIRAPALLRRPSRYLNPGVPDEERALARRGTTLVGSVKSGALVEVVREGTPISETAWRARSFARRAIARAVGRWSAQSAAIVTAIVIGDRAGLDDEIERRLQEAGTYHVIAISGGNIAILAGLTLAAFRLAGLLGPVAMLAAMVSLIAYAGIVEGGASVSRATLMAVIYFAGRAIDLRGPPSNTLAVAAAVLVAAQPLAVADPAFLLTFGATAAIVAVLARMPDTRRSRIAGAAAVVFTSSLAAEIALIPVSASFFSRITFAGLALNFVAIPLMAVAQVAGMTAVAAFAISAPAAGALGWLAHAGAYGLVRSAALVDWVPSVTWRVAPPHWIAIAAYYGGLVLAWFVSTRAARRLPSVQRAGVVLALASAVWILFEPSRLFTANGDGALHVAFMDVGQGDATLVRFPRGSTLVVDAGGLPSSSSFDLGDRVVGAVLRAYGLRRLDTAAITHGDADHIGGLPSIVRDFRPREIWEGIPVPRSPALARLRRDADRTNARWTRVQAGDRFAIDGVDVVVHHPAPADWERQDVRNDDSIVLEIRWRDVSIVLPGDIGRDAEQTIAARIEPAGIRVLKVPHHGSLTSSSRAFLDRLAPRVAIVSAGRNNTFGHPAPDVLKRYHEIGAQMFRTDQDGAVLVDSDGYSVDVRTFNGRRIRVR
jgi:competence protein ComEC